MHRAFQTAVRGSLRLTILALSGLAGCDQCHYRIETRRLPDAAVAIYYDYELEASCDTDAWYLSGESQALPPGIVLTDEGRLRGTPIHAGEYPFIVVAVRAEPNSDTSADLETCSRELTLTVNPSR